MLVLSRSRDAALEARDRLDTSLTALRLQSKASHRRDVMFDDESAHDDVFERVPSFQHLGLEFSSDGSVRLPKRKAHKIHRLFRRAFRSALLGSQMSDDPRRRVQVLVGVARDTLEREEDGFALIDYYLKHVNDEHQLQLIDRWVAQELLSQALGKGHRKGNFRVVSFRSLRSMGLPSLRHRRRLLRRGLLNSVMFAAKRENEDRAEGRRLPGREALSPRLKAAAQRGARENGAVWG